MKRTIPFTFAYTFRFELAEEPHAKTVRVIAESSMSDLGEKYAPLLRCNPLDCQLDAAYCSLAVSFGLRDAIQPSMIWRERLEGPGNSGNSST